MSWFEEYIQRQGQMFMLRLVVGAVFGIFCLYIFSAFSGCTEISYSLYGQKINATVIKAAFDENKQVYRVTYRFNVAGMKQSYKKDDERREGSAD